jgi:hypothetical protein
MEYVFILIAILSVLYTASRTGPFSPASLCSIFATIALIFFFDIAVLNRTVLFETTGVSGTLRRYYQDRIPVMALYSGISLLGALSVIGLPKEQAWPNMPLVTRMREFITSWTIQRAFTGMTVFLAIITVIHFVSLAVGYQSQWVDIISQGSGQIAIVAMCALVYGFKRIGKFEFGTLAVVAAYHYFLMLAFYSRFTGLILMFGAIMMIERAKAYTGRRFSWMAIGVAILGLYMGIFVLHGRIYRSHFIRPETLVWTYNNVGLNQDQIRTWTFNGFAGPFLFAEGLHTQVHPYDPEYMYLSFSPLPGAVDGWKSILPRQQRVNYYTPFNTWLELYYYGPAFLIGFVLFYLIFLRVVTRIYLLLGSYLGVLFASPAIYAIGYMDQYPIRNSFRLMLYVMVMGSLAMYYFRHMKFKFPRRQAEPVPALPLPEPQR